MPGYPTRLNIGSGRTFDETAINIDIQASAGPDIVVDASRPDLVGLTFETRRFGPVELTAGGFEHITASHVLEHVPNVVELMGNCLALLRDGGEMAVRVPYDLAYGAWQDPTHVRAFNEHSWLYYTDWHAMIGWEESRFDTVDLQLVLSRSGMALRKEGMAIEKIRMQPRAVNEMAVVLRKRPVTEAERASSLAATRGHLEKFPELAVPLPARPARRAPAGARRYLDLLTACIGELARDPDLATIAATAGDALDAGIAGDFLAVGDLACGAMLAGVRAGRDAPGRTWIALPAAEAAPAGGTLARLRLDGEAVRVLAGPTDDTLPVAPFERLALLAVDPDAAALDQVLPRVFDRLVPGGTLLTRPAGAAALARFLARREIAGDGPAAAGDWLVWRRPPQAA